MSHWKSSHPTGTQRTNPILNPALYTKPDTTYTVELFANQVIQLLDHLGIEEKVNLSGVSMEGKVISQIASQHPDRISSLISVSSSGFSDVNDTACPRKNSSVTKEEIAEFISLDFPNRAEGRRGDFFNKEGLDWWIDLYRRQLNNKHFERALISTNPQTREMAEENIKIGQSAFPVHFIWGTHDAVCPLKDGKNNALR